MAADWIKMRVNLKRDPHVISMADFLAEQREFINWVCDPTRHSCKESVYEYITSDVTRDIIISSLLITWGIARERGDREGDDLVLMHADVPALDDISGVPVFGEAMAHVGWAVDETTWDENDKEHRKLRFPNFFKQEEPPDEKYKRQHALAQAKYRAKKVNSDITSDKHSDVTMTPRGEERRVDIDPLSSEAKNPLPLSKNDRLSLVVNWWQGNESEFEADYEKAKINRRRHGEYLPEDRAFAFMQGWHDRKAQFDAKPRSASGSSYGVAGTIETATRLLREEGVDL